MHTFQDKSNRHNKQSLTSLDFYPVFVTTTLGKRLAYLDNNVDKSDEYFSSVNDTLIPVLLKYSQVKGYFQNDVVVWFYPTPNFFKQIPFPRPRNIEAVYNRIKSLKEIQPYKNIVNYPLLEKFVVAPMKGVNTITLDPINLKALGFKKTFEGYTYLNQLDEKAYIHLNVNVKVVQKLFISYKFWMGNKSYAINVDPPKNEPIKSTKLNFYPLFITYMDGELVFYKRQYGNMLSQKLINLLVPVKIKDQEFVDKNDTLLLWFTPTKTFFKALPSNIGEELMEEYERYSNPDSFKESKDYRYFESLFSTLSCVEDVTVYPNPASIFLNIDLLVINPCSFKIGIYDLNGVNVLEADKTYQYSLAGRYSEIINLEGLKSSIYFLVIFNEKGEKITKRIIINNN